METLQYFFTTPSRYRRDAVIVSTFLLIIALTPTFWLFGQISPAAVISQAVPAGLPEPSGTASAIPAAMPVNSTVWPARGAVTAEYGATNHPFTGTHYGIDIAGPANQPVVAFRAGTVIKAGALSSGCGRCVYVDHGNGLVSHYSHLSSISVTTGQQVAAGTTLGIQGNTGWSTGPHVHFELEQNGVSVNPRNYVPGNPIR